MIFRIPDLVADQTRYKKTMKEYADLEAVVKPFREFRKITEDIKGNKELLSGESDEDMREMIRSDLSELGIST